MIYITRKFHFSASHRLYKAGLSEEENEQLFGKCSNPNGHGHNYNLEITIAGKIDPETGFVLDLKELKDLVNTKIIEEVDHKNLNLDVSFLKEVIPSTENIAVQFWNILKEKIDNPHRSLYSVKIHETENNAVEYKG